MLRACSSSVELADELVQRVAELGESGLAEHGSDLFFGASGLRSNLQFQASAAFGEPHDSRSPVGRVGLAYQVAALFHVGEEVVDGLLGDLHPLGDLDGPQSAEGRVAEQSDVGRVEVVVTGSAYAVEDLLADPLPSGEHQGADVRGSGGDIA